MITPRGSSGEICECIVIQNVCDRIPDGPHDMLDRAARVVGVGTVTAFLISRLTDTTDRRERSIEHTNDLAERDLFR